MLPLPGRVEQLVRRRRGIALLRIADHLQGLLAEFSQLRTCPGLALYALSAYLSVGTPTCFSNITAPIAIAIFTASKLSGRSCVEYPISNLRITFLSNYIWPRRR